MDNYLFSDLTHKITGVAMKLQRELGPGFLEKVYENGLVMDLRDSGLEVQHQVPLKVVYRGEVIGEYIADLLVEGKIIIELKAVKKLSDIHKAQLIGYLRTTGYLVGLLLNFGSYSLEHKRYVNMYEIEKTTK